MGTGTFQINLPGCRQAVREIKSHGNAVNQMKESIRVIKNGLEDTVCYIGVKWELNRAYNRMEEKGKKLLYLSKELEEILSLYEKTELNLVCDITSIPKERQEDYEVDSIVFDDDGDYGGDQGAPQNLWFGSDEKEEIYRTVREYYPHMTDKQVKEYLKKLNSEGCGYVAVINTIFAAYEGREAEFEETFGFPMYYEGDLNYNKLLVDFYASTDNHNPGKGGIGDVIDRREDYNRKQDGWLSKYDPYSDTTGQGSSQYDRDYRTRLYLDEKGVDVMIDTDVNVNINNIEHLTKDGYVVIAYRNGNLQDINGKTVQYIDGGHAMTITGVTEDGRYIVSSWGEKYYIDPEEIINKNGNTTSMTYSYFQY